MSGKSFMTVPRSTVLNAVGSYMISCTKYLESLREPLVQHAMRPRWLGLAKSWSREEAIEYVNNSHEWAVKLSKVQGIYNIQNTRRIQEITQLVLVPTDSDSINLTAEDAELLAPFFNT